MSYVIGIDLGTTNSVVAIHKNGIAEVIPNAEGGKLTPSVVLFRDGDSPLVGDLAKRQAIVNPSHTVRSVKRLMGRRMSEVRDAASYQADIIASSADEDEVHLLIDGRQIAPVEVSALILEKLRLTASEYLGEEITQAIITVPAYFNDAQRQATKDAARKAGLEPLRIINEPTAAALAYGANRNSGGLVAVFDFGGGTFDISLLEIEDDVFEVLATNGDTQLGGDNIDELLADLIIQWIEEETGINPSKDVSAVQRIVEAAERAKCELSTLKSTNISLPFIVSDESGPKHLSREISRADFEKLIAPILESLKTPCRQALKDAGLPAKKIQAVVLVGGSTRIPAVQTLVRELFEREPEKTVNPDEAVALGAAIQGGVLSGDIEEILLLDVTPLSLGIEVEGGLFRVLIPRNSSIPVAVSRRFTTARDNQAEVDVHVLQGERTKSSENRTLAHLRLSGISPAPAEVPEIEVTFTIDADGILSVSAMDLTSGSRDHMVIESYAPAATSDVARAIEDAEAHVGDDRQFIATTMVKQRAMSLVQTTEEFLESNRQNIPADDHERIREALFRLEVSIHADDVSGITFAENELLELGSRFSEKFFLHRVGESR